LASQSPYRKRLLERLLFPFDVASPGVDESVAKREGGSPAEIAGKLARLKAAAVFARQKGAIVIGSDQVAVLGEKLLDKPGTAEKACAQLAELAGQTHRLLTAVCVMTAARTIEWIDETRLTVRPLTPKEIAQYVAREPAFDCVGSYKIEGLGISLLEKIEGNDPTSIEGIGLIKLSRALRELGVL
jgi:septum formation protein